SLDELDPDERVLQSVEAVKRVTRTATGEITATSMLERFGFTGDRLTARIGDLSGGERRRFQVLRLLLSEPNVLLLDEPTNDLDIETLNVLEDFLDGWPGTLVVVSHDRYFLERVCDTVWALLGDGTIRMLPRGVDEYLELREAMLASGSGSGSGSSSGSGSGSGAAGLRGDGVSPNHPRSARGPDPSTVGTPSPLQPGSERPAPATADSSPTVSQAELRDARKALARIDRRLASVAKREEELHAQLVEHATDYERLAGLDAELREVVAEKEALEEEWLEVATLLD
ncbi:MAG TPA: ATP-binding cassette domain-containing protein, partial [Nocardioidaceae bacterium]|nr:ATP-binding cassette domain-containing protein [Nocardioidaceae bacterium]